MKKSNQTKSDESVIDTSRAPEEIAKDLEIERKLIFLIYHILYAVNISLKYIF